MTAYAPKVRSIFLAAVESVEPDGWATYLDEQCQGDAELRRQVEILLQAHQQTNSLLDARPVVTPLEGAPICTSPLEASADQALPFMGKRAQDSATMDAGSNEDEGPSPLDVLESSTKPGSLGRLGHYEVLEVLGQGGFGTVVKAYDEKLHRMIAIKIMAPRLAATSPARKRFMREARSSAAIRHENVVDIHAIEEQPIPFLVMEYVAGETLQQRLDRVGPLDTLEVLRIGVQIAHGLAAAHAMGKIHRDIKPANILLENGVDRVKITDFGLARAADDASLTQSGLIAGTPMYMAPEQAQGVALDHRADLFSFGSVLYVMCSGRPPFRASTTLAVLKRVADDTPRFIREIIPEVPEWLCEIITKLHAKDPNERFQTAQEVADVLAKYLTELQLHGKVQSVLPTTPKVAAEPTPGAAPAAAILSLPSVKNTPTRRRDRRLAVAAAVLLCVVGGLAFTEATGVTNLRATVIRILTPDGTLVVEVNDPGVKVTVEGDGGLVITGAGLEEIRLRPGNYKVQADRDGKPVPLERELVSIGKGGREVVRVKLEGPQAQVGAKTGAFVLLADGEERKFDTLAQAVSKALSGDTIEIRGNGPFITDPLDFGFKALTIRAGSGYAPVFRSNPVGVKASPNLLSTWSALTLEGLELRYEARSDEVVRCLVHSSSASLSIANCKLVLAKGRDSQLKAVNAWASASGQIRNCLIVSPGFTLMLGNAPGMQWATDNCLIVAGPVSPIVYLQPDGENSPSSQLRLTRNTLVTSAGGDVLTVAVDSALAGRLRDPATKPVASALVLAEDNVCQVWRFFGTNTVTEKASQGLSLEEQLRIIPKLVRWRERGNVYDLEDNRFLSLHPQPAGQLKELAEWNQFWGLKNTGSVQDAVRLRGKPRELLATAPDAITPDDFRLRPDSAGYRAGKDKKDLGADVDLVGPGPAYERWKKTPEYQQWLKDTKQVK